MKEAAKKTIRRPKHVESTILTTSVIHVVDGSSEDEEYLYSDEEDESSTSFCATDEEGETNVVVGTDPDLVSKWKAMLNQSPAPKSQLARKRKIRQGKIKKSRKVKSDPADSSIINLFQRYL